MSVTKSSSGWQRWLRQPQKSRLRRAVFQVHLWCGIGVGLYIVFISVTGSVLVYRNELYAAAAQPGESYDAASEVGVEFVTTLMALHDNFLAGDAGRALNGIGAMATLLLALTGLFIWWPGIRRWRDSLSLRRGIGWRRYVWDLHSVIGFWSFSFIFIFALDMHGALKALEQLLTRAKITPLDTLIFLGDYVDGWSDSIDLVSFLIKLKKKQNCIFLRGNHDDLCHEWLTKKTYNPEWVLHGGQSTIDGYNNSPLRTIDSHINFYENLINYQIDNKNRLFLHAGFSNMQGPEREYFSETLYWDRTLWETALALDPKLKKTDLTYPKRLSIFDEIYIGHSPVIKINKTTPVHASCIWNMDTGAGFKGPLSIIDIDTKEFWQSDPVYQLYPNETGRN